MELFVDNQTDSKEIPSDLEIAGWVSAALAIQTDDYHELGIRIINEQDSSYLNSTYRNKGGATNILSFPCESSAEIDIRILGDLAICQPVVAREAMTQGKPYRSHFAHMIVHGVLHLLGYDHMVDKDAQEMEQIEIAVLAKIGIKNPYIINEEQNS